MTASIVIVGGGPRGSGLLERILANAEAGSGGRKKAAILAGACEALIAALYIDGGIEAAKRFIDCYWAEAFSALSADMRDAKTAPPTASV